MNLNRIRNACAGLLMAAPLAATPLVALAQAKAPAPTPAPAAAPAPAPAPIVVTPEAKAAIKELLDAMNTHDALTQAFAAIAQTLPPRMADAMNRQIEVYPGLSPEQKQKVREGMNPPFEAAVKEAGALVTSPKLVDETMDKMIPIYAGKFTTPEVKQLTAFYRTPLGNKVLAVMPQVNAESLQAGAALFSPRINTIIETTVKKQSDAVLAAGPVSPTPAAKAPAKK